MRTNSHQEHWCCSKRGGELNLKHTGDGASYRIDKCYTSLTAQPSFAVERSSTASEHSAELKNCSSGCLAESS